LSCEGSRSASVTYLSASHHERSSYPPCVTPVVLGNAQRSTTAMKGKPWDGFLAHRPNSSTPARRTWPNERTSKWKRVEWVAEGYTKRSEWGQHNRRQLVVFGVTRKLGLFRRYWRCGTFTLILRRACTRFRAVLPCGRAASAATSIYRWWSSCSLHMPLAEGHGLGSRKDNVGDGDCWTMLRGLSGVSGHPGLL
jgi:hypothetical protein